MMQDIKVYMEVFAGEPVVQEVDLDELMHQVLVRLHAEDPLKRNQVNITVRLQQQASFAIGDRMRFSGSFHYLLQNSFEAVPAEAGLIEISLTLRRWTKSASGDLQ